MPEHTHIGRELDIFAKATNWKSYWAARIRPYLGPDVLEVGAGIGANHDFVCTDDQRRWVLLEPDPELVKRLKQAPRAPRAGHRCAREVVTGTIEDLGRHERFDSVLYIDVLEHILDDRLELARARKRLRAGGTLIVLAPAHPCLSTEFDRSIGHLRRYTPAMLRAAAPDGLRLETLTYLDSLGFLASLANKLLLHQPLPNARQVRFWDRCMVPLSRLIDPVTFGHFGKSLLAVWRRTDRASANTSSG